MEIGYTDPDDILTLLKKEVLADFPDLGDVDYTLTYCDKSLEDYVSPAMYFLPPIDSIGPSIVSLRTPTPNVQFSALCFP